MQLPRAYAMYLLVFIPMQFLGGFLEGAVRHEWGLSSHDLGYQLGAYIAFVGLYNLILGLPAVLLQQYVVHGPLSRLPDSGRAIAAALLAPLAMLAVARVLDLVFSAEVTGTDVLLAFPVSFIVASAAFGMLASKWRASVPTAA
jgi:hypothetical protein